MPVHLLAIRCHKPTRMLPEPDTPAADIATLHFPNILARTAKIAPHATSARANAHRQPRWNITLTLAGPARTTAGI